MIASVDAGEIEVYNITGSYIGKILCETVEVEKHDEYDSYHLQCRLCDVEVHKFLLGVSDFEYRTGNFIQDSLSKGKIIYQRTVKNTITNGTILITKQYNYAEFQIKSEDFYNDDIGLTEIEIRARY